MGGKDTDVNNFGVMSDVYKTKGEWNYIYTRTFVDNVVIHVCVY